jgi:hypothetical protein
LPNLSVEELNQLNYELNIHIEKEEILKCIKKLKNNKARGEDVFNRSVNTAVKGLQRQQTIVIERKSLRSLLSPLFM